MASIVILQQWDLNWIFHGVHIIILFFIFVSTTTIHSLLNLISRNGPHMYRFCRLCAIIIFFLRYTHYFKAIAFKFRYFRVSRTTCPVLWPVGCVSLHSSRFYALINGTRWGDHFFKIVVWLFRKNGLLGMHLYGFDDVLGYHSDST